MIHSTPQSPSHSRLSCLHHCSRKYWHSYVEDIEREEIIDVPRLMGKVGHAGLDAYYRGSDVEAAIEKAWGEQQFYGEKDSWFTLGHMQLCIAKYIERDAGNWKPLLLTEDQIQWENVLQHECLWDANGNMIMAESRMRINIGDGLSIVVVPDLIIEHDIGEGPFPAVIDHKFRLGWIQDKQRSEMEVGHQLRIYALAYEALTGMRCRDGWMNNMLGNRSSTKVGSTAKLRELSMFGPWTHDQMQSTWDWIRNGNQEMEEIELGLQPRFPLPLIKANFSMNPGLHCHYCDFKEECIG